MSPYKKIVAGEEKIALVGLVLECQLPWPLLKRSR